MLSRKVIYFLLGLPLLFVVFQHQIVEDTLPNEIDNDEIECLARNIYFEARNQPIKGQEAVAHVTLNRLVKIKVAWTYYSAFN